MSPSKAQANVFVTTVATNNTFDLRHLQNEHGGST